MCLCSRLDVSGVTTEPAHCEAHLEVAGAFEVVQCFSLLLWPPETSPTEASPAFRVQERSFFVRMKSTLTKRGLNVKASGYKVGRRCLSPSRVPAVSQVTYRAMKTQTTGRHTQGLLCAKGPAVIRWN